VLAMHPYFEFGRVDDIHSPGRESEENRHREDIPASGSLPSLHLKKGVDRHTKSKALSSETDVDGDVRQRHRSA
jgi:hypothetical protein